MIYGTWKRLIIGVMRYRRNSGIIHILSIIHGKIEVIDKKLEVIRSGARAL
jgi:hypothetical protein